MIINSWIRAKYVFLKVFVSQCSKTFQEENPYCELNQEDVINEWLNCSKRSWYTSKIYGPMNREK